MIEVELPDGRILEFPEGTSQDVMKGAIQKLRGETSQVDPDAEAEKGLVGRTVDWFKGGEREESIPLASQVSLGLPKKDAAKMVALLATTVSDDRLQSGIKNIIPGASFQKDQFGNLVAIAPVYKDGKPTQQYTRFYPNPKGLDLADVMVGSGAAALGGGVVKGLKLLGGAAAGLIGAGVTGGTEAALVEAVSAKLSGKPYKLSDIPAGAAGGVIGAKAISTLGSLANVFRRSPEAVLDASGQLKPEIAAQVERMGIDPKAVTADTLTKIIRKAREGVDPAEASRVVEAGNLPVPVPLTKGAVTGDQGQQLFEDMALKGSFGETASSMLRGRRADTQAALQQNVEAIRGQLGGASPTVSAIGGAGDPAQASLLAQREAAKRQADTLYKQARASGPAFVDEDFGAEFISSARAQMAADFELSNVPMAGKFIDDLDRTLAEGGDVRELFAIRQRITSQGSEMGQEGLAARRLKGIFDAEMGAALDDALISGDEAAVAAWKTAISNYTDFASTWKSKGGILNKLTEKVGRDGDMVLKVSPEAASNAIFGVSSSKISSNPQVARDILKLRKTLPAAEWDGIRQEAFVRLANAGKAASGGQDVFSGVNFRKEWQKMSTDNPAMIKTLFSAEERKLINQFANVSARATSGAVNASNSAAAGANILGTLATMLGSTNAAQFATRAIGGNMLRKAFGGARAVNAIQAAPTAPTVPGYGVGVSGQAATTDEAKAQASAGRDLALEQIKRTTGFDFAR
jgi:hypothetical protein